MTEPIIKIVAHDGREFEAGVKYARGYDGAHAEAREVYGLAKGEYKLVRVGWARSNAGLSGCGNFSFG